MLWDCKMKCWPRRGGEGLEALLWTVGCMCLLGEAFRSRLWREQVVTQSCRWLLLPILPKDLWLVGSPGSLFQCLSVGFFGKIMWKSLAVSVIWPAELSSVRTGVDLLLLVVKKTLLFLHDLLFGFLSNKTNAVWKLLLLQQEIQEKVFFLNVRCS